MAMYLTRRDFPIDVNNQSVEIPGSDGVRQSRLNPIGLASEYLFSDAKTIVEALQRGCRVSRNGPCLGWREFDSNYKWLTYEEVIQRSRNISYGLVACGIKPGQDTFVGIFAQNCVEWVLVDQACYCQSIVTVPIYEAVGPQGIVYILNHVEAEVVVCDTEEKVNSILDVSNELSRLKEILAIQTVSEGVKIIAAQKNITLHQLRDIETLGKRRKESLKLPGPFDLATICYTSGTTGNPKGVMITHRNLVVNACAYLKHMGSNFLGFEDRHISFLPLPHIFERLCHVIYFLSGASIGFFRGDIKYLSEDICTVKPTMLVAVPRVLNKIYDKVQNEVKSNKIKRFLLNAALRAKQAELEKGIIRNNSLWDSLVLKNVRNALGGQVRVLISGGAPLRNEVLSFFRCALGCVVIQAYGQTEASGAITLSVMGDCAGATVGPPVPCSFVKLIDVPEMNYYAENGEGEILAKGPHITKGYFKEPLKTAEVFDNEGWLHSGDIGRWMKNGSLAIIDRKKNILKLSHGLFVSPENVESVYMASPYVEQIFVHGDSLQNCLVAILVPVKEELLSWCSQSGLNEDYEKICQNEIVVNHILNHLNQLGRETGLKGFEQAKAIYLHPEPFSQENGILTATMKVKREECLKRFKNVIENMYKSLASQDQRKQ